MSEEPRRKLAALIRGGTEELMASWRAQVRELPSAKHLDVPTLNDHIPGLLVEMADSLELGDDRSIADNLRDGTPPEHGAQRVEDGFDIIEVVSEYNILRGCLHALADAHGIRLDGKLLHVLNVVMDGAIGMAVQTFAEQKALEVRKRRQEYLAFVAHDLRNPLTSISLAAGVLEADLQPERGDAESALTFKTLHRNIRQLEALVAKVLEENANLLSEEGLSLERRHFDLWALVEALVHAVGPVAESAGTRVINAVPKDLVVYADASLLRRVFQNLLSNSIAYTPNGEIRIGARSNGERKELECWVTDNGSGIDAARLERIFEKGEGDPERIDSTGLGLAIVKSFVEAHGGSVRAESTPGKGTTVRFSLPEKAPTV